ncbi:MBL fold metallo-hydrolase [Brevibacterium sp. 5221]|uniref:MBL fold metallo-hydrolase n=1 Tax=Brevibacterium rongguiense TaxID=2695267 RepID=A0A6N9H672_9MICO|nr:MBL fold metallo-hydrolase [Brevibacterium rongguiense]MYM19236.1 MBL fold metallo-hydrolase [Brevibacterium rongguiense]
MRVRADNPSPMTLEGTNTFVLHSADGASALLIDPGPELPAHRAAFLAAVDDRELVGIVLTHRHADHSEALATADEWAPGVPVHAVLPEFACRADTLVDGQRIRFGASAADEVEIIATPGHTSDSISVLHGRTLYSGDTVLGRGTTVVTHPEGSIADYLASIERLQGFVAQGRIEVIEPAHGPVVEDPGAVLAHYLQHRRERLEQVQAAVDAGADTPAQVADVVYAEVPANLRGAVEQIVAAQLEYLRRG